MSFNNNDKKPLDITPDNYEEYLLLYVDEELTTEEKLVVANFIALHPHIKEELEILLSTRLSNDPISFDGKESLLSNHMKMTSVTEDLLLFMDDELTGKEKEAVEKKLASDPEVQAQYTLLLKTKGNKNDVVLYPYKKELYRGQSIKRPLYWLRIAAVALLITGIGAIALVENNNKPVAFFNPIKEIKKEHNKEGKPDDKILPVPQESIPTDVAQIKEGPKEEDQVPNQMKQTIALSSKKVPRSTPPHQAPQLTTLNDDKKEPTITVPAETIAMVPTKKTETENNFKKGVTTAAAAAYSSLEASEIDFKDAVATAENKKGRSIRGFLRKATRFIERTTNIDPVNDDNRLLIGAIALKLK
ncbi:MAG: hypothetical protein ABIN57_11260 [Chitinophagaceae bacterium]